VRIVIVSHQVGLYSNQRLIEAAQARGHEASVVDPLALTPRVGCHSPAVAAWDVAIPRVAGIVLDHSLSAIRWLGASGVPCLNAAGAIALAGDKFASLQCLDGAGLRVPRSCLPRSSQAMREFSEEIGGPPLIMKMLRGHGGEGVMQIDSLDVAEALLSTWLDLGRCVIIQERVGEPGRDVRAVVVDGRVVGAFEREAPEGEFRANVHAGATGTAVECDREMDEMAVGACAAVGSPVGGVDFLLSDSGPVITEVNACPGLKGFEEATGLDLAGSIVAAAERLVVG